MTDEIPPPMPPQPVTTKIPETDIIKGLLKNLDSKMSDMLTSIQAVSDNVDVVKGRVQNLEDWRKLVDARPSFTSDRAAAIAMDTKSQADLAHESELAQERIAREALAKDVSDLKVSQKEMVLLNERQLSLLEDAKAAAGKFLARPAVKALLLLTGGVISGWLTSKGWLPK